MFQLNNFTLICVHQLLILIKFWTFDGYVSNKPHIKFKNSQLNIIKF